MLTFLSARKKTVGILMVASVILSFVAFRPLPPLPPMPCINEGAVSAYLNGMFPATLSSTGTSFSVIEAFPNVDFYTPFKMIFDPSDPERIFVAEKHRGIVSFERANGGSNKQLVLDMSCLVTQGGGAHGLMGFVLHPDFSSNGYFYTWYRHISDIDPNTKDDLLGEGSSYRRLSRFTFDHMTGMADLASEVILINQFVSSRVHTGGGMFFGPDGMLYLGVGDEGTCCEAQSTQRIDRWLLSGILRLDVDRQGGNISHPIQSQPTDNRPAGLDPVLWPPSSTNTGPDGYFIPNDNPWQELSAPYDTLEEFYAIGIRHPYTLSYDPVRDEIWEGDVGLSSWEEINKIVKGSNYEWPFLEADKIWLRKLDYEPMSYIDIDQPTVGPVVKLDRETSTSLIGGFVYRGAKYPALQGKYLFADHATGRVWAIPAESTQGLTQDDIEYLAQMQNTAEGFGIASLATDAAGEVYLVKLNGVTGFGNNDGGKIFKFDIPGGSEDDLPLLLSETGAFADLATLTPSPGVIPYATKAQLWSDGALKKRWLVVPNDGSHDDADEQIIFSAEGEWAFPRGTVFIKHFELPTDLSDPNQTTRLETRFVVLGEGNDYYAVTYRWRDDQTEADLLPDSDTRTIDINDGNGGVIQQDWNFPSRVACKTCHTQNAGRVLGVNTYQLNTDLTYDCSSTTLNQVEALNNHGIFFEPVPNPEDYSSGAAFNQAGTTTEHQLRSYLAANCSFCHRPGANQVNLDLLFHTAFEDMDLVNAPVLGSNSTPGNVNLKPCSLDESEIWVRVSSEEGNRMPSLAVTIPDTTMLEAVKNWILDLDPLGLDYLPIGETGTVVTSDEWETVILQNTYTNPVVIAGPMGFEGTDEATVRVRNVTAGSFEVHIDDWDCQAPAHRDESLDYLVVEAGVYTLQNGKVLMAGQTNAINTNFVTVNYSITFPSNPVILTQCVSENEAEAVVTRIDPANSNADHFSVRLQEGEDGGAHVDESVAWIAIEPGVFSQTGAFEAGTINGFDENIKRLYFQQAFHPGGVFIAKVGSYEDADPVALRLVDDTNTGRSIQVFLQEDDCIDAELDHQNEWINYVTFERAGTIYAYGTGIRQHVRINVKALLQGPHNMQGLLNTTLSQRRLLPMQQPYDQIPWSYAGKREVVVKFPDDTVDWVLIEIRDENDPQNILAQRACLLDESGSVRDIDGQLGADFGYLSINRGYVSMRHRNHLGVMTAGPVDLVE